MEAHVPRVNLKAFSNALMTIGKIGKEVFMEATDDGVRGQGIDGLRESCFVETRLPLTRWDVNIISWSCEL